MTTETRHTSWLIRANSNGFLRVLHFKCPNKPLTLAEVSKLPRVKQFVGTDNNAEIVPR
jgi:hypothetical protein